MESTSLSAHQRVVSVHLPVLRQSRRKAMALLASVALPRPCLVHLAYRSPKVLTRQSVRYLRLKIISTTHGRTRTLMVWTLTGLPVPQGSRSKSVDEA